MFVWRSCGVRPSSNASPDLGAPSPSVCVMAGIVGESAREGQKHGRLNGLVASRPMAIRAPICPATGHVVEDDATGPMCPHHGVAWFDDTKAIAGREQIKESAGYPDSIVAGCGRDPSGSATWVTSPVLVVSTLPLHV